MTSQVGDGGVERVPLGAGVFGNGPRVCNIPLEVLHRNPHECLPRSCFSFAPHGCDLAVWGTLLSCVTSSIGDTPSGNTCCWNVSFLTKKYPSTALSQGNTTCRGCVKLACDGVVGGCGDDIAIPLFSRDKGLGASIIFVRWAGDGWVWLEIGHVFPVLK